MIIWIDIINPSHALFFNSFLSEFSDENYFITIRDRAETVGLMQSFGLKGTIIGRDYRNGIKKSLSMVYRTLQLYHRVNHFNCAIGFENGMSAAVAKLRRQKSILFCDNDLKFVQKKSSLQDVETKIKLMADYVIVPEACTENFRKHSKNPEKIISYPGYKEDVYIADFKPDSHFKEKISFDEFVVVRPEALGSFYVKEKKSIVPELLKLFEKENVKVVYLPREPEDAAFAAGFDVYIPEQPLNGLDLCYYANAVLTGSGTMAREAACMEKTAVSFFPSKMLLSVDKKLVEDEKIFHSRNPDEIVKYVLSQHRKKRGLKLDRSKKVKKEVINKVKTLIEEQHGYRKNQ